MLCYLKAYFMIATVANYYVHDADDLLDGFYDGYNDDIGYLEVIRMCIIGYMIGRVYIL